jgi:nucleotide-binding universal stress UspA family protein
VLVIGSTHRGPIGRVVLGSVGELLLAAAPCPVAVAPRGFAAGRREVVEAVGAGFDGSDESLVALRSAHQLASEAGARLRAISVTHPPPRLPRPGHGSTEAGKPSDPDAIAERLTRALSELGGDATSVVVEGDPVERLAEAGQELDLLVLGTRGYGPLHHVLLGSVSAKLMRSAPCPLLVMPQPASDPAAEDDAPAAGAKGER